MRRITLLFLLTLTVATVLLNGCSGHGPLIPPERGDSAGDLASGFAATDDPGLWAYNPDNGMGIGGTEPTAYKPAQLLVVLQDGTDPSVIYPIARKLGLKLERKIKLKWAILYRMAIDNGESVETMIATLRGMPEVRYAEPNYIRQLCAAPYYPNDPLFEFDGDPDDDPWNYKLDQWGPNVLGASLCWPDSIGTSDTVVAVIDTGYRWSHEDLVNQVWINADEIPDNGIDDDNNGYIDDWRGWDFGGNDNDTWDYNGHGTACAGVVAAQQDNVVGCTGIAPGVRVMPLATSLADDEIIEAAQYAYDNGAHIISMSFHGYGDNDIMHETFTAIYDNGNGVLCLASAGNDNTTTPSYPNSWPEVVRVGATCSYYNYAGTRRDVLRITPDQYGWGSNWGDKLELMAPGYLYISVYHGGDNQYRDGINFGTFGGTSNSSPCLAGCFGLLKSASPEMTAGEMRLRMRETADDLYTPGHDDQSGYGQVNVWRAIHGSEPNKDIYDINGHIPVKSDNTWQYDDIFDVSTSQDYDFEDIFSLQADQTGIFWIEMDAITTGEDLDMELFNNPELAGEPVEVATGPNGDSRPLETIAVYAEAGQKFYLRVYSPEPFNTSSFRVRSHVEQHEWWVQWKSLTPIFVLDGTGSLPLIQLEVHTNFFVTLDEIKAYIAGDVPLWMVNNLRLYEDTDKSGNFEPWIDQELSNVVPSFNGTNQVTFSNLDGHGAYLKPLRYFVVADVGPNELGYNVTMGAGLHTYKDISIVEDVPLRFDPYPMMSRLAVVGQDHWPPVWDTTVGLQLVVPKYKSVDLYWNNATDILNEPTKYNVYWDDEYPPEISTGAMIENIATNWGGENYKYRGTVTGLQNDLKYYFLIRAIDGLGNEDTNEVWLEGTPDAIADPANPELIGSISLPGDAWEVWVHDKIAYVAASDSGVHIIDCNIPETPQLLGTYPGIDCYSVQYHEGQGYVYAGMDDGLKILDCSTPSDPQLVGAYTGMTNILDIFVDGDTCYIGDTHGKLIVLDVTDPADPQYQGEVSVGDEQAIYGLTARDGYAYCTTVSNGLSIVDATTPTTPGVVKNLTLNNYTYEVVLHGNYALVTNWYNHRLFVIDITDPPNAAQVGELNFPGGYGSGVAVRDDQWVYVGRYNNSVMSVDWSNLSDIKLVGAVWTQGPDGLFFDGDYVYSAENTDGLKIIL